MFTSHFIRLFVLIFPCSLHDILYFCFPGGLVFVAQEIKVYILTPKFFGNDVIDELRPIHGKDTLEMETFDGFFSVLGMLIWY